MKAKQLKLKTKKTKKSKHSDDEGKPKRSLNVYNLFFAIERKKIIAEQKERAPVVEDAPRSSRCKDDQAHVGFANLARIISERWKTIDPVYKMELEEKARLDKIRFDNEMKLWCAKKEAEEGHDLPEQAHNIDGTYSTPRNDSASPSFNTLTPTKPITASSADSFCGNYQCHPVSVTADLNEAKAFFQESLTHQLNFLPDSTSDSSVTQTSHAIKSPSVPNIQLSTNVDDEIAELSRHYGFNMNTKTRRHHRPQHSLDDYTFVYEAEEEEHQPVSCVVLPSAAAQEFPYYRHKIVSHDGSVPANPSMASNPSSPVDGGFHFSDVNAVAFPYSMYPSLFQGDALVSPSQGHMTPSLPHILLCYQGSNAENRGSMPLAMTPLPYAPAMGNARDHSKMGKPSSEEIREFITGILSLQTCNGWGMSHNCSVFSLLHDYQLDSNVN